MKIQILWNMGQCNLGKKSINASEQIEASLFKAEEDGTTTSLPMCKTAKRQIPEEFNLVFGLTEISFQQ